MSSFRMASFVFSNGVISSFRVASFRGEKTKRRHAKRRHDEITRVRVSGGWVRFSTSSSVKKITDLLLLINDWSL